jgi:hypothetical protein
MILIERQDDGKYSVKVDFPYFNTYGILKTHTKLQKKAVDDISDIINNKSKCLLYLKSENEYAKALSNVLLKNDISEYDKITIRYDVTYPNKIRIDVEYNRK